MPTKRMRRPTVEECREYAIGMDYRYCDPEEFWFHYEAVGWKVGRYKKPMESWRKAMGGWNSRNRARGDKPRRIRVEGDSAFEGRF